MTLAATAAFTEAASKASAEPRFHVTIALDTGVSSSFLSGVCSQIDVPITVSAVTPISRSVDILQKSVAIDSVTFTIPADEWALDAMENYGFKGATITILFGFAEIALVDFRPYFKGIAESPRQNRTSIEIPSKTAIKSIGKQLVDMEDWFGKHPVEMMKDIIDKTTISSDWYDTASLTPSTYATTNSHHVIGRVPSEYFEDKSVKAPVPADLLIGEIAATANGMFLHQEDGKLYFKEFDTAAVSAYDFTEDDIADFEIVELYDKLTNRVVAGCHPEVGKFNGTYGTYKPLSDGKSAFLRSIFIDKDTNSQDRFGSETASGKSDSSHQTSFTSGWIEGFGELRSDISDAAVTPTINIYGPSTVSMCGARWPLFDPSGSPVQPADAKLSATRTAYLLVEATGEILECDGCVPSTTEWGPRSYYDSYLQTWVHPKKSFKLAYDIVTRGALGSTAAAVLANEHSNIYDITLMVQFAQTTLVRMSNGLWRVKWSTDLSKYALQNLDAITFTLPDTYFTAYSQRGLTTATKWQIVKKKINGNSIEWEAVFYYKAAAPALNRDRVHYAPPHRTLAGALQDGQSNNNIGNYYVVSGFGITTSAINLSATVGLGVASSLDSEFELVDDYTFTMKATRDNWIGFSFESRSIVVIDVAVGAAEPDKPFASMWLHTITTGAAGAVTELDKSELHAVKSLDLVDDGSTYLRLGSVDANHLAQEASLDTGVVTNTKLGDSSLSSIKAPASFFLGSGINANISFEDWTAG